MNDPQRHALLECVAAFQTRHPCNNISRLAIRRKQYVFHAGERSQGLYLVIEGLVKVTRLTRCGSEKVVHIAQSGDFLAESPFFLGKDYDTSAQTATDTVLLRLPEAAVSSLLNESPQVFWGLLGGMARKVGHLIQDIEANAKAGHARITDFLLANLSGIDPENDSASVSLPLKKGDLASHLGLSPQHFSKILRDMRNKGLIEVRGLLIRVPSITNLRKQAPLFNQGKVFSRLLH